ncbi:MAG: hypothetical protein MPK62_01760 [Alphaproteobacteria bacterium]|nr:hypothetical protein [Alphaproteobacteria bacterium]MDA8029859.1 hypothetical protein [Alphaproteobacteria bacterium]
MECKTVSITYHPDTSFSADVRQSVVRILNRLSLADDLHFDVDWIEFATYNAIGPAKAVELERLGISISRIRPEIAKGEIIPTSYIYRGKLNTERIGIDFKTELVEIGA